ncbi:MAG: Wzz/FepE/Etk N-terminal domain-containing protein [Tissierellales bacterium]
MEEIELRELFYIILRKFWIIVLVTILSLVTSGVVSYFVLDSEYETFTTLMLIKPNTSIGANETIQYNDVLLNQKLVATYGEIVKSRIVSSEVIENLGLEMTPEQLKNKVEVSLVKDTEIIKIVVSDNNPELATTIANEIASVFRKNVVEFMKIENVKVIDKAEVPTRPIKPRPMLNMAIAGVLGIMLSVFLVFLLDYMDNTIKTPSDVEGYLNLPIIGMIPKTINKGRETHDK